MKKWIFFAVGAVLGSGATFLAVKEHYKRLADEEIVDVKSVYRQKCEQLDKVKRLNDEKDRVAKVIFDEGYTSDTAFENVTKVVTKKMEEAVRRAPDVMRAPEEDDTGEDIDEDEDDPEENAFGAETLYPVDEPDIYSITPTQFVQEMSHYDKLTLLYFNDDGQVTVVDDQDQIIPNPDELLGDDYEEKFGEFEDDVAYIRNDHISTDFEVIKNEGGWPGANDFKNWDDDG